MSIINIVVIFNLFTFFVYINIVVIFNLFTFLGIDSLSI